ncbi:MAG: DUF4956 domain-containing protein [Clostridia bacterium]|nr:DUF4956 domain-containing protein [Clostridia bacterium]
MGQFFKSVLNNGTAQTIKVSDFLLCISIALVLGFVMAIAYMVKNEHSNSFIVTLALLPAVVCVVIMMVNGHIGAGVAVAGAFSLVRFRSAPGSAKEIVAIFLAMGTGLICGMGYLGFAALFTLIMCVMFVLYNLLSDGYAAKNVANKTLNVTIPEDLDYTGAFDDIFEQYTKKNELVKVKTTNMGSMFRLTYNITLRDASKEKEMIDRLRERNGNLEIMVSKLENRIAEL